GEPLKAEEYELFLSDPGDYTFRYYLPRVWGALAPLAKLPPLQSLMGVNTLAMRAPAFSSPEIIKAFEAIFKAGQEQEKHTRAMAGLQEELEDLGFVPMSHGMAAAPFDVVSDYLRGMAGTMIDMFRHPDELLRVCDMFLKRNLETAKLTLQSKRGNPKRVGSALHRGSDGFMSLKQFGTFYWPTFKAIVLEVIRLGMVHIPFYEGNWEQRLEYLLDFPKGKTVARFALTDLKRAKEVLKGHTCIMGGVPHSLLQTATPQEVEDYCKDIIETVGKDGGFILTTSTGLTHEAKPENVRAMMNAALKYGRY
ncbi:uroporphyrinogen decarboxylase family protein, partial [Chloroflexota bacterium]